MDRIFKSKAACFMLSLLFLMTFSLSAYAENHKSMEHTKSTKVFFDFRISNPASALIHIKLIHDTYSDKEFSAEKPEFVVIFMGGSVNLLTKDRDKYSPEDRKTLEKIDEVIAAMSKNGIQLEICLVAVNIFGIDPGSLLSELHQVENGWISSIRYQQKGYAQVPAF